MEIYEMLSRVLLRRKYVRVEEVEGVKGRFVVRRKRVKVPQLKEAVPSRPTYRLNLRRFRLRFVSPGRLVASLKETYASLMVSSRPKPRKIESLPASVTYPRSRGALRSSSNDVVDEAWFDQALRRSIAEGRLTL